MSSEVALRALVERFGDDLPLDRALLALAKEEYPDLDEARYLAQLDQWGGRVERRMKSDVPAPVAIREVLFSELGLKGNSEAYYDPDNSLLNQVLDRRLGIPITLAAVYIEVARRVGQSADGVGFPGHFLVVHRFEGRELLLDAFNGGEPVSREECVTRIESMSDGRASLADWMLEPSTGRSLVARVLTNLKVAYAKAGNVIQAVRAIDRLLAVAPERHGERRDRGLLYAELGLPGAAADDFEAYLAAAPQADDREALQRRLPGLWAASRRMN